MRHILAAWLATLFACADPYVGSGTGAPAGEESNDASMPEGMPGDDGDESPMVPPEEEVEPPRAPAVEIIAGCTAKTTIGGFTGWLHFARPNNPCNGVPGSTMDFHAIVELTRLINSVPAGGRIDGHLYAITVDSVGKALYDAQLRGVDVRISTDGALATSVDPVKTMYLDKLRGIVYCVDGTNRACVANATTSVSHTKLFVFSRATAPDQATADNVVWFGSVDPTLTVGSQMFNNSVTIYGDTQTYGLLRGYLDDLRAENHMADYYESAPGRGHYVTAAADIFISPELQSDLVLDRLNELTPTSTCEVRVMQNTVRDSRMTVVNKLIALKNGGCNVQVVANTVLPMALAALQSANIPVRHAKIYDKVFVIKGMFPGGYLYRVYTGSHNLGITNNNSNDEILVKLPGEPEAAHPVYDAFMRHFDDAYAIAAPF